MHIARIQVEEGFLDGLDLALVPGLVTVICARGTGKTSVIELIRFCLGVNGHTPELSKRSREHALSVLGSGQVTITIAQGGQIVTVSRTEADGGPRSSGTVPSPIIFSQTEIENVGMQAGGRMRLLDGFVEGRAVLDREEAAAAAEVRSLTLEVSSLRLEIEEFEGRRAVLPGIEQAMKELAPKEAALSGISKEASAKTTKLASLAAATSSKAVATGAIQNFALGVTKVQKSVVEALRAAQNLDPWPAGFIDLVAGPRSRLVRSTNDLQRVLGELTAARTETEEAGQVVQGERLALEESARALRREVEELQAGAGAVMRQAQQLRENKAQLDALSDAVASRRVRLTSILTQRNAALDELDAIRGKRFQARLSVVNMLNSALQPRIRLGLTRCGQFDGFGGLLADALRGSGLRYGELSLLLAEKMSPRELVEAAEETDIDLIADVAGINADRALKLVSALAESALGSLATTLVEDDVTFELLDGKDYKDIADLSTGQRCTVVLPIVLQHRERLLIVDQPEDHIDNAFIADTLIQSVKERNPEGQILFSTHNANIPVLGAADLVVELGSDGKRGFVRTAAPLDDKKSVHAITSVMEGGAKAFETRAAFYREHSAE